MNRPKVFFALLVLSITCVAAIIPGIPGEASASVPAAGSLDTTFGTGGTTTTDIGRAATDSAESMWVQSDGKIVVAGTSNNGVTKTITFVRFNAIGTLDASFDGDGKVSAAISNDDYVSAFTVQSDGKIIAVGQSASGGISDFLVLRFNQDGSSDSSFGTSGRVNTSIGTVADDDAQAVTVQQDGKIVVVGQSWFADQYDFTVVRYLQDGRLDTSFHEDGKVTTNISTNDYARSVAIQPDGDIVVVGKSWVEDQYDFTVVRYLQDGSLDSTFSGDGKVTTNIIADTTGSADDAYSVALQLNGKIIVAGHSHLGSQIDFAVVRYNSDGSLDTSFDGDGKVTTNLGEYAVARSVALHNDKIIAAGSSSNGFAVVRYEQDGRLDTTFSGDGKITTSIGDDSLSDASLQSDGKIIIAGTSYVNGSDDFAVVQYSQSGSLDTTFGTGGIVTTNIAIRKSTDHARSIAIQQDGKIIIVGESDQNRSIDFAVLRYNTNGTLDNTFGTNGKIITDIGNDEEDDIAESVAVQSDGKIVVVGRSIGEFVVVRYNTDGSLDTTFGTGGIVTTSLGTNDSAKSVVIHDGKIIVAGDSYQVDSRNFAVVRYLDDGRLDTTFDVDGKVTTDIGSNTNESAYSATVQSDGRIIVVGETNQEGEVWDFAVVRYNNNGSLDTSFDDDGKVVTATSASNDAALSVVMQSDDKIIVAGESHQVDSSDFTVVRYNTNGSLDTSFDSDGIATTKFSDNANAYARSVALQSNGRIIVAGGVSSGGDLHIAIARYNTNGALDATFDSDGKVTTEINNSDNNNARSVAVQSDGKIIAAGDSNQVGSSDFAAVRYNSTSSASTPAPAPPVAIATTTNTVAPVITVTPVITAETTNTQATSPIAVKRGRSVPVVALTKSVGLNPKPGSRIALKVRPKDSARCIVTETGVQVLGKGLCRVTVTVTPKARQSTVRTVMIKGT
jgi:uncharacterized delta-60 repeat protein